MDELAAYEHGFRRAGLPLLIEDYSAREDVFTRAVPVLTVVFLAEVLGAIDLDWSVWANLAAVVGGLAIVIGALGLVNRGRGRPFFSRPRNIGAPELAGFVVIPALLPLVFGGQWRSALVTSAGNLVGVGLVYAVIGYGLVSIVRWAATRVVDQLVASVSLLARALPLLMLFAGLLLFQNELWQAFAALPDGRFALVLGLFVVLGTAFLVARVPREVVRLEEAAGTGPPLRGRQRLNVALVLLISQSLQVLVVAVAVGLFFAVFGALAIPPDVQAGFLGHGTDDVVSVDLLGGATALSQELLRVAGAIAALSGFYYAIAVLTDSTYREEFLHEITDEMRETFRQRTEYLARREVSLGSGPPA